jgi:hypothetical protein
MASCSKNLSQSDDFLEELIPWFIIYKCQTKILVEFIT